VLASRGDPFTIPYLKDAESAAAESDLNLLPVRVDGPKDFEASFDEMNNARTQAVMIQPLFSTFDAAIVAEAARHRIAILSSYGATTRAGGLISYSADHADYFARAATKS
jgi:hypothetical protein